MLIKNILVILFAAVFYFLFGKLGLYLAIPPGFASAVWPASGVALAFSILYGKRALIGIVLGSFILNTKASVDLTSELSFAQSVLTPLFIALGTGLQGYIGTKLVKKYCGGQIRLILKKEIIIFFILIGPVASVTSSSIGSVSLYFAGIVAKEVLFNNWLAWWAGDCLGAIVFTPLFITFLNTRSNIWRTRRKTYAIPVLSMFFIVLSFFLYAKAWESERLNNKFIQRTKNISSLLQHNYASYGQALSSVMDFYKSSGFVDRSEFKIFVERILESNKSLWAISWNPVIRANQLDTYIKRAKESGIEGFRITERDKNNQLISVKNRDEYVVVYYIEPQKYNEKVLGFDVASNPTRKLALELAAKTKDMVATGKINLVQGNSTQPGFLLFNPYFKNNKLEGHIVGVFSLEHLFTTTISGINMDGLELELIDITESAPELLFRIPDGPLSHSRTLTASFNDEDLKPGVLAREYEMEFSKRKWKLRILQTEAFYTQEQTWHAWFILFVGLLLTSLVGAFLLVITGANERLEFMIRERTEKLLIANESKSRFLANMSHEIRTPLNGILGFTEILLDAIKQEDHKDILNSIGGCGKDLLVIINDILDFSKIESGNLILEEVPFDLKQEINNLVQVLLSSKKEDKNEIKVVWNLPEEKIVVGDVVRVKQILFNIVGNANKFTKNGLIKIMVELKETNNNVKEIQFKIIDTGVGIPKKYQKDIFNSFAQADTSTTRKFGGTGLGLAISQSLVKMMGGEIHLESVEGKGSNFSFSLYLKVYDSKNLEVLEHAQKETQLATNLSLLNILIVEDNLINQKIAQKMISSLGGSIDIANNGKEAIDKIKAKKYDIVFMDCQMPVMDGFAATSYIRASDDKKDNLIIVALSASAMKEDVDKCLQCGMNDFISKPVAKKDFIHIFNKFFSNN